MLTPDIRQPTRRILLIEDDDIDVMMFERALQRRDLSVELRRAHNGAVAIDMLHSFSQAEREMPTIIVLDLNMPCMSGTEFLRRLRADPQLAQAVVIAFTTSASPKDVQEAWRLNVAAYVVKEVTSSKLENIMEVLRAFLEHVTLPFPPEPRVTEATA